MRRPVHTNQAFTLIELLVVIAVIGLLLTVTLPSLARAKRQAQSVCCQSNLHQLMLAAIVYTESHDGRFPMAYYTRQTPDALVQYNWDFTVRFPATSSSPSGSPDLPPTDDTPSTTPTIESGILWEGERVEKIQQCPSFTGASNTPYDLYTGYNYNTSYIGHGQLESIPQPVRRSQLNLPSRIAIFGDGQSAEGGANKFMRAPLRSEGDFSFNGRWAGTQGFRHNQRTNVAWGDGSTTSQAEYYTVIDPARQQSILEQFNQQNPGSPVGFLSPNNTAYKTR